MPANGSGGRQRRESETGVGDPLVVLAEAYDGAAPGEEETNVQDEFIKVQEQETRPEISFRLPSPESVSKDNEFEPDPLTLQPRRIKRPDTPLVLDDEPSASISDSSFSAFISDSSGQRSAEAPFHARENRGGVAAAEPFPVGALLVIVAAAAGCAFVVYWFWLG